MATSDLPFPTSQTASTAGSAGGSGSRPSTGSGSGASGGSSPSGASLSGGSLSGSAVTGGTGSGSTGSASAQAPWTSDGSGTEGAAYRSLPSSGHEDAGDPGAAFGTLPDRQGDLLSRVVQGAHHTIDRLAEAAAPHVQKLQQGVSSTGNRLSSSAGDAREVGDEWAESLRCTVRENPIAALATAVAVGVLLSRISR